MKVCDSGMPDEEAAPPMEQRIGIFGQLFRFQPVGCTGLGVHWTVVAILVSSFGMHPLLANVFAGLAGFQVGYWGDRITTFQARSLRHRQTLPRFIIVACTSFTINESLYYLLLSYTRLDYRLALLLVLSRQWAFRTRMRYDPDQLLPADSAV